MQLIASILSVLALSAFVQLYSPAVISQGNAEPACFPLSKLTTQLQNYQESSAAILKDAPFNLYTARQDESNGVKSIVTPLDLLNPQVQPLQNEILVGLSTVGAYFRQAAKSINEEKMVKYGPKIQEIFDFPPFG